MTSDDKKPIDTLTVLVTADEAYPALERLFLDAKSEIVAGFRVFDLNTRLRSDEAREVGETWFDLFQHTLERGVSVSVLLTDFDPIAGTRFHRKSWQSAQQLIGAQEISGKAKLDFRIALHPAKAGFFPRAMLWTKVRDKVKRVPKDSYTPGLPRSPDSFFDVSPATHHQKLAVFDRASLYIGGLDLDERRYDTSEHDQPADQTWQDVQVVVTGTVANAAHQHLTSLESVVASKSKPPHQAEGFLRTVSSKRKFAPFHISPKTIISEIETAHFEAISRAKGLIYLETQYFRHQPLAEALAEAAQRNSDLHLITVLPAAPEDVAFEGSERQDAKMGEHLQASSVSTVRDGFGRRALFCSPAQPLSANEAEGRDTIAGAPIIYVHSKVSIFDTTEAIVSSANLNGRSFRWDTEAGVHLKEPGHVRQLAKRISEHWMATSPPLFGDNPAAVFSAWQAEVHGNKTRHPKHRSSFLLPYDEKEAAEFGEKVAMVPKELF